MSANLFAAPAIPAEISDPINARILAARIPRAQLEVVPEAGHLLLMEQADDSATTIAKFLNHERAC